MFRKQVFVKCSHELDFFVYDDFWHADDVVFLGEVWEFAGVNNVCPDHVAFDGEFVCDGCCGWAVWAG